MEYRHPIDHFGGIDEDYIQYLECAITQSRQVLSQIERSNHSPRSHPIPPGQQRWKKELNTFLRGLPVSCSWVKKREDVEIASVEKNRVAIRMLLGCSPVHRSHDIKGSLVERAQAYAQCAKAFQNDVQFNTQLVRFQEFIFISWCVVDD